jgi:hypothetical protein
MADQQLRQLHLAMTDAERDRFLAEELTCRVATVSLALEPHITPMWFIWDGASIWLYSQTRSRRWADLRANPLLAVVVDTGMTRGELCGVELTGICAVVGEQPRIGTAHRALAPIESAYAMKYLSPPTFQYDGRHAWLCVSVRKIVSWDFRKRLP